MPMTSQTSDSRMGRTASGAGWANWSGAVAMISGSLSLREPFKNSAGEFQILPRLALVRGGAQQVGRMIRDDEWSLKTPEFMDLTAHAAEAAVGPQQVLHGDAAHRQNQPRADQLNLTLQIGQAGSHFRRRWVAITRRPAF